MCQKNLTNIMKDGNIAVSDYDNKWISIHEHNGKFVMKMAGSKLLGPKGVTVAHTGELIVVDNKGSCVYILQPSGKVLAKFGSRGSELDQFAGPHYAAINSCGNIVISDFHNHNIKVSSARPLSPHISHFNFTDIFQRRSLYLQLRFQW